MIATFWQCDSITDTISFEDQLSFHSPMAGQCCSCAGISASVLLLGAQRVSKSNPFLVPSSCVLCLFQQVLIKRCLIRDCSWGKFLADFLTSQKTDPGCLHLSQALHTFPVLSLQIAWTCLCLSELFRILPLVFGLIFQAVIGIFCKHECLMLNRVMTENNKMKSPFPPGQEIFVQNSTVNS